MKRILGMKRKFLAHGVAAILLGCTALASVAVTTGDAVVQTVGAVSYVSGGIGTESIEHLESLAGEFNLKLVFALNSGAYASDVRVTIADAKGKTLVDTTSEGPWFLARLPAGNYRIVASLAGNAEKRQIAVGAAKLRTVDFRWATE